VTLAPASQLRRSDRRSCPTSPGRPAFRERRYRRRGRSESSRQSGLTGHAAQAAMMPAAWSRALCTFSAIGNHSSGSTRGLAHRACRYTRPASSLSVRSPGAQWPRRCAIISTGCTSYHAAVCSGFSPVPHLLRGAGGAVSPDRLVDQACWRRPSRARKRGATVPALARRTAGQPDDHSASKHQMDPTPNGGAPTHPSSATPTSPPTPPSPGGTDASSASNSPDPEGRSTGADAPRLGGRAHPQSG